MNVKYVCSLLIKTSTIVQSMPFIAKQTGW